MLNSWKQVVRSELYQKSIILLLTLHILIVWMAIPSYAASPQSLPKEKLVPRSLIDLGHKDGYALLVEKKSQQMFIYNSKYSLIKVISVTTGMQRGDKERSGDKRTPEGIYFFSEIKEDRELLPKYGIMALTMNYPNLMDERANKRGDGIWLHATDQPARAFKQFDTLGCVVVVNEDMMEISKYVTLETTPIIIEEEIPYIRETQKKAVQHQLVDLVKNWRNAWQEKNIERYIALYSNNFICDGMDKQQWRQYKNKLNRRYSRIDVNVENLNIFMHQDYAVAVFIQQYKSNMFKSRGIKRLYLVPENDTWKIIDEEWTEIQHIRPWQIAQQYRHVIDGVSEKPDIKRESWIKSKNPSHYALQLLGVSSEEQMLSFINKYGLNDKVGYFKTLHNGKDWYVLIYGEFRSAGEAKNATQTLPSYLKHPAPWIRTFKSIQLTIDQTTGMN